MLSRTGRPDVSALAPGMPLARLLTGSGAMVTILRADVAASAEAVAALTANPVALGRGPVTAIVHASGVLKVRNAVWPPAERMSAQQHKLHTESIMLSYQYWAHAQSTPR